MIQLLIRFMQMLAAGIALVAAAKKFMDELKDLDFVGDDFRLGD